MMCSALLAAPAYQSADRCLSSGRPETGVYPLTIGSKLKIAKASDWSKIRDVRNLCAGHPAKRANGVPATHQIRYELWDARDPRQPSHPAFNLSAMIKAYDAEGAQTLIRGFARWHRSGGPVPTPLTPPPFRSTYAPIRVESNTQHLPIAHVSRLDRCHTICSLPCSSASAQHGCS